LKLNIGYFDLVTIPGEVPTQICKLRSISFAKMDEASSRQFFDKAVAFIVADLLPGIDKADLERQGIGICRRVRVWIVVSHRKTPPVESC
jgi:hypothetical protein